MTEKAKLTKEQAERLQRYRDCWSIEEIIKKHINRWVTKDNECLNSLFLDEVCRALYIGYEIEETEEEKVIRLLECRKNTDGTQREQDFFKDGYCTALLALNREHLWKVVKDL